MLELQIELEQPHELPTFLDENFLKQSNFENFNC